MGTTIMGITIMGTITGMTIPIAILSQWQIPMRSQPGTISASGRHLDKRGLEQYELKVLKFYNLSVYSHFIAKFNSQNWQPLI
jgi:hypothetical protein